MSIFRAGRVNRVLTMVATAVVCLLFTSSEEAPVAGIQGSGFAYRMNAFGQITRFGSIFVNGVEYDTSAARILINDRPGSQAQLRVGQVVAVKGNVNADGTAGAATDVSFESDVLGPLAQVDLAGGTLVVLGQRIRLLSDTFLDEQLHLGGLLGLLPGIMVQVSGFPNAAGEIEASRIDLVLGSPNARLRGVVQALDTSSRTFRVNTQTVDYSDVAPSSALANGSTVSIEGSIPVGQTSIRATRVDLVSGLGGAAGERGQMEGLITAFNSASDFTMGMQRIATNADTQFILHGQPLGPNLAVEVRGEFDAAGVLVAHQVKARPSASAGVRGAVESVSVSDRSLRVLGIDFTASEVTAFDDQSSHKLSTFGLADVRVGDYVEIRGGTAGPAGAIEATAVKRSDGRNDFYVEGTAREVLAPTFKVLGVRVITTPQTRFPGGGLLAGLKFFVGTSGRIVRVRGTFSGPTLVAEEVEMVK